MRSCLKDFTGNTQWSTGSKALFFSPVNGGSAVYRSGLSHCKYMQLNKDFQYEFESSNVMGT